MEEIKFISKDGIAYEGIIKDIIKLSKKQRNKLWESASKLTSDKIEKNGIELIPDEEQERTIIEEIKNRIGREEKIDIKQRIAQVIKDSVIRFTHHAEVERMPDPKRNCPTQEDVISRLIMVGKVKKFKVTIIPGKKQPRNRYAFTTENKIGKGKLAIQFSEQRHILIITVMWQP